MTLKTKHRLGLLLAFILTAAGVVLILTVAKPSPSSDWRGGTAPLPSQSENYVVPANQPEVLVDLTGKWVYKGTNGLAFVAEVKSEGITIDLATGDGASMSYWVGTFKDQGKVGVKLNSIVDTNEIILSQDNSKVFTIGENSISFEFQAMGVKRTIELTR